MRARGVRSRIQQRRHRRSSAVICCGGGARREWPADGRHTTPRSSPHYAPWPTTRRVLAAARPCASFRAFCARPDAFLLALPTQADDLDHEAPMEDDAAKLRSEVAVGKRQKARFRPPCRANQRALAQNALGLTPLFWLCCAAGPWLCGWRRRGPRVRRLLRVAGGVRRCRPRTLCVSPANAAHSARSVADACCVRSGRGLDRHRARHPRGGCRGRRARGVRGARRG